MKPYALLVIPVLAVVAVSGCTGISIPFLTPTSSSSGGSGIVIESFEPDFSQIYSTESVKLALKLRNSGTVDGKINSIMLTGTTWTSSGGSGWDSGSSSSSCSSLSGKMMLPAVPDKGISGETKNCVWTVKPKQSEVPNGLSVTFYPTARVTYRYSTSTAQSITIGTSQELRSLQDRGGTLPSDTTSTTGGPISISVVSKGPIRVSQSGVEFPIEIKVSNTGGGIVCDGCSGGSSDSNNWNKIKLTINTGGLERVEGCGSGESITLWRGRDNTIGCKLKATSSNVVGRVQKVITVRAEYDYIVDATTSITVTGVSSESGFGSGFIGPSLGGTFEEPGNPID